MDKKENSWSQRHYDEFMVELNKIYQLDTDIDTEEFIAQIKVLEAYSLDKKRLFCLFNQTEFFLSYISENLEAAYGYSLEDLYNERLFFFFTKVYWKQLPVAIKVHQWGNLFRKALGEQVHTAIQEIFYCGLKIKDKWGVWRVFFIKQRILSSNEAGKPLLSFMELEDITAIYKSDKFWSRMIAQVKDTTIHRAYFQGGKKKEYADILSPREMEILQLIIAKKDNAMISALLNISKNTVERHRKNMIARLGVTDMTALIHICQLSQVL